MYFTKNNVVRRSRAAVFASNKKLKHFVIKSIEFNKKILLFTIDSVISTLLLLKIFLELFLEKSDQRLDSLLHIIYKIIFCVMLVSELCQTMALLMLINVLTEEKNKSRGLFCLGFSTIEVKLSATQVTCSYSSFSVVCRIFYLFAVVYGKLKC